MCRDPVLLTREEKRGEVTRYYVISRVCFLSFQAVAFLQFFTNLVSLLSLSLWISCDSVHSSVNQRVVLHRTMADF